MDGLRQIAIQREGTFPLILLTWISTDIPSVPVLLPIEATITLETGALHIKVQSKGRVYVRDESTGTSRQEDELFEFDLPKEDIQLVKMERVAYKDLPIELQDMWQHDYDVDPWCVD